MKTCKYICKDWEHCPKEKPSVASPCIVIVDHGSAAPENCPYSCWSGIEYPEWEKK